MNGKEILQTAHQMAGLSYLAEDSAVVLDASGIKKVAAGMDVGTAELMLAKDAGADMLIAHHATFAPGCLDGYKSLSILLERMVALGAPPAPASKIIHNTRIETKLIFFINVFFKHNSQDSLKFTNTQFFLRLYDQICKIIRDTRVLLRILEQSKAGFRVPFRVMPYRKIVFNILS